MKDYLIVYHKEDNDGLMSMSVFYNWLLSNGVSQDNIRLLGVNYNDLSRLVMNSGNAAKLWKENNIGAVIMTDISFNEREQIDYIYEEFGQHFIWVDHHKPIIDYSLERDLKNAKGIRDTKHSAVYNAWKYCYPDKEMPELIKEISAFDSWSYEAEGIDFDICFSISEGCTTNYDLDPEKNIAMIKSLIIDKEADANVCDKMLKYGRNLINYNAKLAKRTIEEYGDKSWTVDGRSACALFLQRQTSSTFFEAAVGEVQNGIVFKHLCDGNWSMNLYNVTEDHDFHCGNYLKEHYNGGGHEGAAGCTLSEDKFIELLKAKKI